MNSSISILENHREAVRLGRDVFETGSISRNTLDRTILAFRRIKHIIEKYQVRYFQAVATSALRDATNKDEVLETIESATGIKIKIIDGEREAQLVFRAVAAVINLANARAVIIDIGGGSVEIMFTEDAKLSDSASLNIGTVRFLTLAGKGGQSATKAKLVQEYEGAFRSAFALPLFDQKIDLCIGTGGNVEAFTKLKKNLFRGDKSQRFTKIELDEMLKRITSLNVDGRIAELGLKADRADVIEPAGLILLRTMDIIEAKEIIVPGVGLKDGLLLDLADAVLKGTIIQ